MDDVFTNYMLHQYNARFKAYIIHGCKCYENYKGDAFVNYVFRNRNSYFCCIYLTMVTGEGKYIHQCFPIMLGSEIDFTIRKIQKNEHRMFGAFIVDGMVRLIPNFMTNDLKGGHVYRRKLNRAGISRNSAQYIMEVRHEGIRLKLVYNNDNNNNNNSNDCNDEGISAHADGIQVSAEDELFKDSMKQSKKDESNFDEDESFIGIVRKKPKSDTVKPEAGSSSNATTMKAKIRTPTVDRCGSNFDWLNFLRKISPTPEYHVTEHEYSEYFEACIKHAPKLDDLANKTIVTPPALLERVLRKLTEMCEIWVHDDESNDGSLKCKIDSKKFSQLNTKLKSIFRSGNMFFVLSNKDPRNVMKEFKCVYQLIDGQKLHLISKLNSSVKRYVSNQTRNSKALYYPADAYGFICPISIKEMHGAGENVQLSHLTISSPELDDESVLKVLKALQHSSDTVVANPTTATANVAAANEKAALYRVSWDGFLTNIYLKKSLTTLIVLKKICPFLSIMVFDNFLKISTKGHTPMKYSARYGFFVTPYEKKQLFQDAFANDNHMLIYSSLSMKLSTSVDRLLMAKSVVAISNIKGGCQKLDSELAISAFLFSIGANTAIVHNDLESKFVKTKIGADSVQPVVLSLNDKNYHSKYLKLAEIRSDEEGSKPMPEIVRRFFDSYSPISDGSEIDSLSYADIIENCESHFKSLNDMYRMWIPNQYMMFADVDKGFKKTFVEPGSSTKMTLSTYSRVTGCKFTCSSETNKTARTHLHDEIKICKNATVHIGCKKLIMEKYDKEIKLNPNYRDPNHLVLYCAFGDFQGATDEDGIILDSNFVDNGPSKFMAETLNIRFTKSAASNKRTALTNQEICTIDYVPIHKVFGTIILIGILYSRVMLGVTKSKRVTINSLKISDYYRHLIFYKDFTEHHKVVDSFYENSVTPTVTFHYNYIVKVGKGSKISTTSGQKGVVSKTTSLSSVRGWRADGTMVHAQVLFSPISIIGRTATSQCYEMLTSKNLAVNEYGDIIAPISFNVHHIDASEKARVSYPRSDLMCAENGFLANKMTNVLHTLSTQTPNYLKNAIHFVNQLNLFNSGVRLQFLDTDSHSVKDLSNETDTACKKE